MRTTGRQQDIIKTGANNRDDWNSLIERISKDSTIKAGAYKYSAEIDREG